MTNVIVIWPLCAIIQCVLLWWVLFKRFSHVNINRKNSASDEDKASRNKGKLKEWKKWHITIFKKECTTYKNVLSLAEHEAVKYLSIKICCGLFWLPPFYWKMWKNGNARLVALTRTRHHPAQWRQVFPSHSCSLCSTPLSWNEQRHTRQSKSQSHNEGTLALFYDNCTHFLWICQSVKSDLRCIAYQLTYCGRPFLWNTLHRESEAIDEQKVVKWQGGVLNFWFGPILKINTSQMSRRKETRLLGPLINHNSCKFKISVCKCGMTQFVCLLEWITSTTPWSTLCARCSGETEDLLDALALRLRLVFMNHWLISQQSVRGQLQSRVLTNHVNELFSEGQSEWLSKRREL